MNFHKGYIELQSDIQLKEKNDHISLPDFYLSYQRKIPLTVVPYSCHRYWAICTLVNYYCQEWSTGIVVFIKNLLRTPWELTRNGNHCHWTNLICYFHKISLDIPPVLCLCSLFFYVLIKKYIKKNTFIIYTH